ncbi:CLUMA_CG014715, isoform A [Clunio marinus]|uniref:CLUMA_CG014715, isoform A n=1 Tax=Clunio marinus TaxID=568069 RepID=A0A1J1IM49_9DIPT|nr:CLUMA_CG014715, isoform A [Clunio marinus]
MFVGSLKLISFTDDKHISTPNGIFSSADKFMNGFMIDTSNITKLKPTHLLLALLIRELNERMCKKLNSLNFTGIVGIYSQIGYIIIQYNTREMTSRQNNNNNNEMKEIFSSDKQKCIALHLLYQVGMKIRFKT